MTVGDYKQSIIRTARAKGIDPSFVAGIMNIESGGNPRAGVEKYGQRPDGSWFSVVSYAQGIGLMQVIPVEAPGNWSGRPSVSELLEAEFSIDYGASMLADNIARCGSKEGAACAYFAGHCVPTGASDPNASDYQYIQRAMAAEQRFLEYNTAGLEDVMQRLNGSAEWWPKHSPLAVGRYEMNVEVDFPGVPPTATDLFIEVFTTPGPGRLVVRDGGSHAYAGQFSARRPEGIVQVKQVSRRIVFDVELASVAVSLMGIVGYS